MLEQQVVGKEYLPLHYLVSSASYRCSNGCERNPDTKLFRLHKGYTLLTPPPTPGPPTLSAVDVSLFHLESQASRIVSSTNSVTFSSLHLISQLPLLLYRIHSSPCHSVSPTSPSSLTGTRIETRNVRTNRNTHNLDLDLSLHFLVPGLHGQEHGSST